MKLLGKLGTIRNIRFGISAGAGLIFSYINGNITSLNIETLEVEETFNTAPGVRRITPLSSSAMVYKISNNSIAYAENGTELWRTNYGSHVHWDVDTAKEEIHVVSGGYSDIVYRVLDLTTGNVLRDSTSVAADISPNETYCNWLKYDKARDVAFFGGYDGVVRGINSSDMSLYAEVNSFNILNFIELVDSNTLLVAVKNRMTLFDLSGGTLSQTATYSLSSGLIGSHTDSRYIPETQELAVLAIDVNNDRSNIRWFDLSGNLIADTGDIGEMASIAFEADSKGNAYAITNTDNPLGSGILLKVDKSGNILEQVSNVDSLFALGGYKL